MPGVLLIVGCALLLMGLAGPGVGLRGRPAAGDAAAPQFERRHARQSRVLILRIAAAVIGLWLVAYAAAHLIHRHRDSLQPAIHGGAAVLRLSCQYPGPQ
jgi:hypothetical protein